MNHEKMFDESNEQVFVSKSKDISCAYRAKESFIRWVSRGVNNQNKRSTCKMLVKWQRSKRPI